MVGKYPTQAAFPGRDETRRVMGDLSGYLSRPAYRLDISRWPPMARPQNRKRQQVDDQHTSDRKKSRLNAVHKRSRRQQRKPRVEPRNDRIHNTDTGVFLPGSRKRPAADLPQEQAEGKRLKSNCIRPSNFPPEFYDNLSKVWLTPRALLELERRNESIHIPKPAAGLATLDLAQLAGAGGRDLARFARTGGPDLRELRGFPLSTSVAPVMASSISSSTSRRTQTTKPTTVSTKRSSAYDNNFRQHCVDRGIYFPFHKFPDGRRPPKPTNLDEIRQALKVPRGSLSPSVASESAFEDFQYKNTTKSEGTVMRRIIPLIAGDADIPNEGHIPFTNFASITENMTVNPNPDFFDGVLPEAIDQEVREALDSIIIPTKKAGVPIAPNLFLEAKGTGGSLEVAEGQVVLNGAHGAILMLALQNHLLDSPVYDGNAYTFSASFLGGYLNLYAHHPASPDKPGQNPSCHITQLNAYALTGNHEGWLEGIGAFRNLRWLAKKYRDHFIDAVNERSRERSERVSVDGREDLITDECQGEGSSPTNFFDCLPFAEAYDEDRQDNNVGLV